MRSYLIPALWILLLAAPYALLQPHGDWFPVSADLAEHCYMVEAQLEAWRDGELYSSWDSNRAEGWGEPRSLRYPPLTHLSAAALVRVFGLPAADAVGLVVAAGLLMAIAVIFSWLARRFGRAEAFVGSALFATASSMHLFVSHGGLHAYTLGVFWASSLFVLIVDLCVEPPGRGSWLRCLALAATASAVALSNPLAAAHVGLVAGLAVLGFWIRSRSVRGLAELLVAVVLAGLLSSFQLIPMALVADPDLGHQTVASGGAGAEAHSGAVPIRSPRAESPVSGSGHRSSPKPSQVYRVESAEYALRGAQRLRDVAPSALAQDLISLQVAFETIPGRNLGRDERQGLLQTRESILIRLQTLVAMLVILGLVGVGKRAREDHSVDGAQRARVKLVESLVVSAAVFAALIIWRPSAELLVRWVPLLLDVPTRSLLLLAPLVGLGLAPGIAQAWRSGHAWRRRALIALLGLHLSWFVVTFSLCYGYGGAHPYHYVEAGGMTSRSFNEWRKREAHWNYSMVYKARFKETLDRLEREGPVAELECAPTTGVQPASSRGHTRRFHVRAKTPDVIKLRTYDSPVWSLRVVTSSRPEGIVRRADDRFGRLAVAVPAGEHTLEFRAGAGRPYTVGLWVSLLSSILVIGVAGRLGWGVWRTEGPVCAAE